MPCCHEYEPNTDLSVIPLGKRLVKYGTEFLGPEYMKRFPTTKCWVFTFIDGNTKCKSCLSAMMEMNDWMINSGLLTSIQHNVKFVLEANPSTNRILKEYALPTPPLHLFCRENGDIFHMHVSIPGKKWLETYLRDEVV
jgi:hypothetical protein